MGVALEAVGVPGGMGLLCLELCLELTPTPGGKLWSELVKPRTFRPSAALISDVSWASGTEVSPLYMKSTIH